MRNILSHYSSACLRICLLLAVVIVTASTNLLAQDSSAAATPEVKTKSYVKNTFSGNYLIDDQTVMVPVKKTFGFYISHHFGTVNQGISNFFGVFELANMQFSLTYVPVKDLQLGFGFGNYNMEVNGNAKYALLKQTKDGSMPVSVTYFGLMAMNTQKASTANYIVTTADRFSYFNQILIARKVNDKLSLQVGIAITHFNNVAGYYDSTGKIQSQMQNSNWTFCAGGKYQVSPGMAIIVNYDQPLTQNAINNPQPNISFGLEMTTSGHDFQIFAGNYGYALPTDNTVFNQNNYRKGQFVIGFIISRLWNF
jgi:hypothetical protein